MVCPNCGFERKIESHIHERPGELVEIERYTKKKAPSRQKGYTSDRLFPYTDEEKARFYAQLRGYGLQHGYAPGWAKHKFREKFRDWPPYGWDAITPMTAGPEVVNYIRYGLMKWIEQKRLQEAALEAQARPARGDDPPAA